MEQDAELILDFEAGSIPTERWRHREHLRVAFIYLRKHGDALALKKLRSGIQLLNRAHGVREARTSGYHETLTVAWVRLVAAAVATDGPFDNSEALLSARPDLLDKRKLLEHYSRDLILSSSAKCTFVEPDLEPLPETPCS